MIRRRLLILLTATLLPLGLAQRAGAAALVRDLGRGLAYIRIHELPGDLAADPAPGASATALDLRFVRGDSHAALLLETWVRAHATGRSPVLILSNASTSPRLLASLAAQPPLGLIFIGAGSRSFTPDIVVKVSKEKDQRAYEALEKGASVESLLADNPGKPRVDEELLEREHLPDADTPDPETLAEEDAKDKDPPPLVDAALQRAVQIHRGLLALHRL